MQLNEIQLDALQEVINIGVGQAARSFSEMTGSRIELTVPNLCLLGTSEFDKIAKTLDLDVDTTIQLKFEGDLTGQAFLGFPRNDAFELARIVGGVQSFELEMDEELVGVLEEIGNILINAVLGSIANILECELSYNVPTICTQTTFARIMLRSDDEAQSSDSVVLIADTAFKVAGREISGSIIVLFDIGKIDRKLSALTDGVTIK